MEVILPKYYTKMAKPTNPTKINIIVQSIPENIVYKLDVTFLSVGLILNILIIFVIALKSFMRTSTNCYIISISISCITILSEPLQKVLKWYFDVYSIINMDYVCLITYDVSVLTIIILSLEMYVCVCQADSAFTRFMLKKSTAIKGILLMWCMCIMFVAIELHLYDFFEGIMDDIYVWFTCMFTFLPCIVFFIIDSMILYELAILKSIEGQWRRRELWDYIMLLNITLGFFLTMAPYRIARAVSFVDRKASCCTEKKREILFFIVKTFPIIFPFTFLVFSMDIHRAIKEIITCRYRTTQEELTNEP